MVENINTDANENIIRIIFGVKSNTDNSTTIILITFKFKFLCLRRRRREKNVNVSQMFKKLLIFVRIKKGVKTLLFWRKIYTVHPYLHIASVYSKNCLRVREWSEILCWRNFKNKNFIMQSLLLFSLIFSALFGITFQNLLNLHF